MKQVPFFLALLTFLSCNNQTAKKDQTNQTNQTNLTTTQNKTEQTAVS